MFIKKMQNTNPVVVNVTPATGVPVSVVPVEDEEVTIPRGLRLAFRLMNKLNCLCICYAVYPLFFM